jgi:hypothetical protein
MTRWRIANASRTSSTCSWSNWLRATSRTMTVTSAGSLRQVRRRIFVIPSSFSRAGSSEASTARKRAMSSPQFSTKIVRSTSSFEAK